MTEHSNSNGRGPRPNARFAEHTGRAAAIGALDEAALLLDGIHGTTVTR